MTWKHSPRLIAALLLTFALALVQTPSAAAQSAQETAKMRLYIQQLEEQVRQLTGEVERLRFEMRRTQAGIDPAIDATRTGGPTGSINVGPVLGGAVLGGTVNPQNNASVNQGAPPQDLGSLSIAVDDPRIAANGVAAPLDLSVLAGGAGTGLSGGSGLGQNQLLPPPTAALFGSPRDEYNLSFGYIVTSNYELAEQSFRVWLQNFSDHELALDARFWLAESLHEQGKNREAANVYLEVYKSAPDSRKAPNALMKLGVSLAALGERDAACATFSEMENKFPDASPIVSERDARAVKKAGC